FVASCGGITPVCFLLREAMFEKKRERKRERERRREAGNHRKRDRGRKRERGTEAKQRGKNAAVRNEVCFCVCVCERERDRERKRERDRKREIERRGREERSGAVWSSAVGTAWSGGEGGWRWVLHLPVTVLLCHAAPVRKGALQ